MNHDIHTADPFAEEYRRLQPRWGLLVVVGTLVVLLGLAAIGSSLAATVTTVLLFGVFLMAGGVLQVVNAFMIRSWRGFFLLALVGVLHVVVGLFLVERPLAGAAVLTLVMAVGFLFGGAARLLYAATHSFRGRGWTVFSGVITLLLGVSIWQGWPESSLWVIGLFVGIELVFSGWSLVVLGLTVKAVAPAPAPARAA